MNDRYKELFSNTLMFTIANLGSKVLVFFMVPLYTAVLSPPEFGVTDLISTTVTLLYPLFTICIVDAVLRFCFIKEYDIKQVFSIGVFIILAGSLLTTILSIFFRNNDFFIEIKDYIYFIPLSFCTTSLSRLVINFSRGINKIKISAINGVIHTFAVVVLNLFFLLILKWGILGYLLSLVISDLMSIVFLSIYCKTWNYFSIGIDKKLVKEMVKYSFPLMPNSISWWLLNSLNRYFLNFFIGISAVGIFSATMRIPTILTVLANIFAEAWLLSALKDYGTIESKKFIKKVHENYFILLLLITGILILISKPLVLILLSNEYSMHWHLIPYLFISVFFGALSGFIGSLYSAEKKTSLHFTSTLVGGVISIVITLVLLQQYGIKVIAMSMMLGYFVIWLIRRITIIKYVNIGIGLYRTLIFCTLLILDAIFVTNELYILALICVFTLILLNCKYIISILCLLQTSCRKK